MTEQKIGELPEIYTHLPQVDPAWATIASEFVTRIGGIVKQLLATEWHEPSDPDELPPPMEVDGRPYCWPCDEDGNPRVDLQPDEDIDFLAESFVRYPSAFEFELRHELECDNLPPDAGVRNFEKTLQVDRKGEEKLVSTPIPQSEMLRQVEWLTGIRISNHWGLRLLPGTSWPRRFGKVLFVPDRRGDVHFLLDQSSLLAYLQSFNKPVHFLGNNGDGGYITKGELLAALQQQVPRYLAVEPAPHEPRISGHYYACRAVAAGDGKALRELLDRFEFASEEDKQLGLAALVTPCWGGPAGARPLFVIADDYSNHNAEDCGVGKSTFVQMIARVWGGTVELNFGEGQKWGDSRVKQRLLDAEGLRHRIVLIDNVKSDKMSWAELEGMVTAKVISGHALHIGESQRPNVLTYFLTVNGPGAAKDIATRALVIKLGKPDYTPNWQEDTEHFIDENRELLWADAIALLRGLQQLNNVNRFGAWGGGVLARLPGADALQQLIMQRQAEINVETDSVTEFEDFIGEQLATLDGIGELSERRVFLPNVLLVAWWNLTHREKCNSPDALGKKLARLRKRGLTKLSEGKVAGVRGRWYDHTAALPVGGADEMEAVVDDVGAEARVIMGAREAAASMLPVRAQLPKTKSDCRIEAHLRAGGGVQYRVWKDRRIGGIADAWVG
jgi:hypothetical protein